ncbi:hypothetical protein ACROYT_G015327 [Oculina patagonica]
MRNSRPLGIVNRYLISGQLYTRRDSILLAEIRDANPFLVHSNIWFYQRHNGKIKINDNWEEPFIAWLRVCAKKGQKKSAVLNVISKPVREVQNDLRKDLQRLLVDHFSFEKLHQVMTQNNNHTPDAYNELTQFYNMLDQYNLNSTIGEAAK